MSKAVATDALELDTQMYTTQMVLVLVHDNVALPSPCTLRLHGV